MTASPSPGASADVARVMCPELAPAGSERPITVDQTNASVVVDESVIVKWLNEPVPAPHPAAVMLSHLAEVGFAEVPTFHGTYVVDGMALALVHEYLPGAADGWEWYTDEFTGMVDGVVPRERVLESADRLGRIAARLHVALATPSSLLREPIRHTDLADEEARFEHLLADALAETTGDPAAWLAEHAERIAAEFTTIGDPSRPVRAQPLHGDLHAGQFLRAGDRLVVTDFDGNPLAGGAGGLAARRPTAVDLASLVQSVDHVGRVAAKRRPGAGDELERAIRDAVAVCLGAYRSSLDAAGAGDSLDEALLWPLRVAQELHELVYAARHLPRWAYAPAATLASMFPERPDR